MKKSKDQERKDSVVLLEESEKPSDGRTMKTADQPEEGSHAIGIAAGGTSGAAAGTAIGAVLGGPIGGLIGAAAGAIAGGFAGKGIASAFNPSEEEQYWREYYKTRPYYEQGREYEAYAPGYKYGWESASRPEFRGKKFEEVESQLLVEWPNYHSTGEFTQYRDATRDAFQRVQEQYAPDPRELEENEFFDTVRRNWNEFKRFVRARWDRISDRDIDESQGRRELLARRIQERYQDDSTFLPQEVTRELNQICSRL